MPGPNPFRYFNSSPRELRLVVMIYVCFPLSLRNVGDLLFERGIRLSWSTRAQWRSGVAAAPDLNDILHWIVSPVL